MIPFSRIEAATSSSFPLVKVFRGWLRFGLISSIGQEKNLFPSSSAPGSRAAIPLPRPVILAIFTLPANDFLRQLQIACRPPGRDVVQDDRLAVARGLGEADISRNDHGKGFLREMGADLLAHLAREVVARVVHGKE